MKITCSRIVREEDNNRRERYKKRGGSIHNNKLILGVNSNETKKSQIGSGDDKSILPQPEAKDLEKQLKISTFAQKVRSKGAFASFGNLYQYNQSDEVEQKEFLIFKIVKWFYNKEDEKLLNEFYEELDCINLINNISFIKSMVKKIPLDEPSLSVRQSVSKNSIILSENKSPVPPDIDEEEKSEQSFNFISENFKFFQPLGGNV
mmetsp:Transcript_14049/g.12404  ORF Transcript_14049/g.12404 Transcript_14049/m.12404 type:complete len:205 (-) Transcript_14049:28-642(-)